MNTNSKLIKEIQQRKQSPALHQAYSLLQAFVRWPEYQSSTEVMFKCKEFMAGLCFCIANGVNKDLPSLLRNFHRWWRKIGAKQFEKVSIRIKLSTHRGGGKIPKSDV